MKYFFIAFILALYFDLLGRYFLHLFKKEAFFISFPIGITFTMAILYIVGWPISINNLPSIYYVILLFLYFVLTLILIFKNIKKLDYKFDYKLLIVFFIFLAFEIYMSYHRTLGDPHGFDAVYYINYISANVDTNALNSTHPWFGTTPNNYKDTITYVFQSYNYFISSFIYILQKGFGLVGVGIDFLPAYYWIFQIQLHIFFISISLISIKELKMDNRLLNIALAILLVLFMNNFYYNIIFGFIGNSFRMSIHALASIFLFRYFKSKEHSDLYIFFICMLGLCGFSSTGTFATIFVLFGLFFYLYDKEKDLLKYYCLVLYMPTINILSVKLGIKWYVFVLTFILFFSVYKLNDTILNLYKDKRVRYGTIILLMTFIMIMNIVTSGKLFDFSGFINNYSEQQDMSWDYFDFMDIRHYIFNLLVLIPLFYSLIKNHKHPFSIVSIVLILTIFNPLGGTFINKICWVYYRTYDIIINQFTLAYFIYYFVSEVNYKQIPTYLVLVSSLSLAIMQYPRYYHYQFKPDDGYNPIAKIENSELEMIKNVVTMIDEENISNPRIINTTFYMNSYIHNGEYLIGKERRYNYDLYDDVSYNLYLIFYPSDGWDNFRPSDEPKYDEVIELLKQCDYDILVLDNSLCVDYKGQNMTLADAICSDGTYTRSKYSTSTYAVIDLRK